MEAQTRDARRTDVIVDYGGEQFIVELKIWHGAAYFAEGLEQLAEYMESRGQNLGWLLTFCFQEGQEKRMEDYTREITDFNGKKIYSVVV